MSHRIATACAVLLLAAAAAPAALSQNAPASWDNLVKVDSPKLDAVYLLPGADFRGYTKVMLDPTEVAFRKNYQRDMNRDTMDPSWRITTSDMTRMSSEVEKGFAQVFTDTFQKAGYQVVSAPGPDVLRLRTGVANLYVTAPDKMTPGRSTTFSREAGEATLVLEARDSETGELLGRAVDRKTTGDMGPYVRNSVTNRSEFEQVFRSWANAGVNGLNELKARSPIPAATAAVSR